MDGEREKCALIMPRRNFLIRALGFTAAGAAVAVPIIMVDDAQKRLAHHVAGMKSALADLFPGQHVDVRGNCLDGAHSDYQEYFARGERKWACVILTAGPDTDEGARV